MRVSLLSVLAVAVLMLAPAAQADPPPPGSTGQVGFDLYGDDWKLPAGHRVGVLLTSSNSEWWLHRPTLQPVTVNSASVALPWRSCGGGAAIEGGPSIKLDSYKASAPFVVPAATIAAATDPSFALPGALGACS